VLQREGRILALATPDELRSRTGADGLDEAFLQLIQEQGALIQEQGA
jgi:ABC-2 type transport system ATP-binding protein